MRRIQESEIPLTEQKIKTQSQHKEKFNSKNDVFKFICHFCEKTSITRKFRCYVAGVKYEELKKKFI